jgi:hypothetical protein
MEHLKNLMGALLKAKSAMGALTKDSKNPHFKSSYASLAAVVDVLRQPLADNGIVYIESPVPELEPGRIAIDLTIYHAASGESVTYRSPVMVTQQMTPQGIGSTLTYARRYQLMTVFGLAPEDDDGNEGAKAQTPRQQPQRQAPPVTPVTPANGNGHKTPTESTADDVAGWAANPDAVLINGYTFKNPAEAQGWGMAMGVFRDDNHAANAYNEVKREHSPKTPQAMWDVWINDVARRVNEKKAEPVTA